MSNKSNCNWIIHEMLMVLIFLACIQRIWLCWCEFFMQYYIISHMRVSIREIDNVGIISNLHVTWEYYQIGNSMHMGKRLYTCYTQWNYVNRPTVFKHYVRFMSIRAYLSYFVLTKANISVNYLFAISRKIWYEAFRFAAVL